MITISQVPLSVRLMHEDSWDLAYDAWRISRPHVKRLSLDDKRNIRDMDTPVGDLVHYTLHLKVPILIREILASHRRHIMWARTSRADDIVSNWEVYGNCSSADMESIDQSAHAVRDAHEAGESQEKYRQWLPMAYMTEFTWKVSHRNLVKIIKYFEDLSKATTRVSNNLSMLYDAFVVKLRIATHLKGDYSTYGRTELLPEIQEFGGPGNVAADDGMSAFVFLYTTWSFRSQAIRHGALTVFDDLKKLATSKRALRTRMADRTRMYIIATKDTWREIFRSRNCWIAQYELWDDLRQALLPWVDGIDRVLPCDDGAPCPYVTDNNLRLEGNDPNPPCPIQSAREDRGMEYAGVMRGYLLRTGRPQGPWEPAIASVERSIK